MTIDFSHFSKPNLVLFGESITYVKAGPVSRTIYAIVVREPAEPLAATPDALRPGIEIHVQNKVESYDASAGTYGGISAGELDTGTDSLKLPRLVGGTPEAFSIVRILGQDEGMLRLEVR